MDLICALLMPAIRVIDTYSASHKGSLREPAHTGILQDARGTPSSQRCRFAANGAWLVVEIPLSRGAICPTDLALLHTSGGQRSFGVAVTLRIVHFYRHQGLASPFPGLSFLV